MNNVISKIGDVLIVNINPEISGKIHITEFSDSYTGITDQRTVNKEFRITTDNVFWTDWKTLTNENLSSETYISEGQITIQLRLTREGTDDTGEIIFNSIDFYGNREPLIFNAPTLMSSIFSDLVGTNNLKTLAENLFKKLYYRGILPDYITRAENVDQKEDKDFIDLFYSIAFFFSLVIRFSSRFEKSWTDYNIMLENVRQLGLYFDDSNVTLDQLQYLSKHYYDEIRKRGTAMIFKRQGDVVNGVAMPLDGELIRLLRSSKNDELLYENIPLYKTGWCLGQCSPMYRGTCQSENLNKTGENTKDFKDLNNFLLFKSGSASYEIQNIDSKNVLRLYSSSTGATGIGRSSNESVSTDNMIVVDSRLDYEITFAFQVTSGTSASLLFGVEGFDNLGNKLNDSFITPNGDQISEQFFNQTLDLWKKDNWYFVRGIIHSYSTINIDESKTNIGIGTNLYFNNSFVKYIIPKIQINGSSFDVKIWDYKIRPLVRGTNILPLKSGEENSHSMGFIESQKIFYAYMRSNNNNQSKDDIINIIEKYLLPFDTTDMFVFMSNY